MRKCPKCDNSTVMKITAQNPSGSQRERRGFLVWLITLPWRALKWLFRFGVRSDHETYNKPTMWRCNYCTHTWDNEKLEDAPAPAEEVVEIVETPPTSPQQSAE